MSWISPKLIEILLTILKAVVILLVVAVLLRCWLARILRISRRHNNELDITETD